MGDESLILREDGLIRLNFPVTSLTYYSNLNKILVKNELGSVHVLDVNSGAILQTTNLSADEGGVRGVEYVPGPDRMFVWDGSGIGARTDYNGVLLLHTALQQPLPSSQPEKPIKIELVLSEAILLYQCLQSLDALAIEGLSDFVSEVKQAVENEPIKKGVKAQKWSTITINLPQTVLRLVTAGVVQELKSQNRRIPALAIASAIGHRVNELMPYSREEESRALMYSEAERKETFKRWPHMDYKWALPARMAQAGFYHQPTPSGDDRAMCFTCMVCLVCWEKSDEPWVEHERHSPNCPFVRGEYTHNVPISVSNATACAVPSPNVTVVSKGNTGELVATGTSEGKVNIWRFDCGLKLTKYVLLSPYDSIFSGILATDCNKVWSASLEKDTSTYGLELTAMAFVGLTSQLDVYPSAEPADKDHSNKTRPSLVCAVTITRTPLTPDQPIREDDASKALFDSGDKSTESVQAMNVENEAKSNLGSNKMLFLLTYDIESGNGGGGSNARSGGGKKPSAVVRSDDANIYDEIYLQYSDDDGDLPHCTKTLLEDQVSNVINLNATSSKDDAKPWEPKQILINKHYKVLPPPPPTALLPELHDGNDGGMLDFVDKISQMKTWKSGNLDSVGTKLADQTDAAVLQQADPITHYLNMTGQLEMSGLKWYEGGDGTEKIKVTAFGGGQSSAAQAQADAFEDANPEDAVLSCPAVQCLRLPLDLQLSDSSRVTHLLPVEDTDHLLVIVSGVEPASAKREAQKEIIDPDGDISMDVDEAPAQPPDVPAYLLLYKSNGRSSAFTLEDEPAALRILEPGESPVDASIVGRGKRDKAALATVGVDGSLRLYSLPDLTTAAEKQPNRGRFAALADCGAVERLAAATLSGTLYFYAMNDVDSAGDVDEELASLDASDSVSPPRPLGVRGSMDLSDLQALTAASGAHGGGTTVPYTAVVPGFWCELSPARADPPHTRAWRLQNTSSTWDEHILELTAAGGAPDRVLLHYTLHSPAAPPRRLPRVHVTLLRQSLRAGAYRAPSENSRPPTPPSAAAVDGDEFLAAHGAEVLAGPVPLSAGLDLTRQAGTLVLTSPRLYRAHAHTFLIHIKTIFDPAREAVEMAAEAPDASTKKAGFIGCDWLHQMSITLRSSPPGEAAPEVARQQRIAMLENDAFLDELLTTVTSGSTDAEKRALSLDLALWVTSIRLARLRLCAPARAAVAAEANQLECLRIVEKHTDALIKNCILCSSRSVAKKCIKIILITSEGAKNLSKPWKSTFEATLTSCVSACLPLLGACESPGAMRWLVALAQHTTSRGAIGDVVTRCLGLLEKTAKCITERGNQHHNLLRARFGLYGLPLERTIFDIEGPVLGKSTATPVTYASLLSGDTASAPIATPKPDCRLRDLLHLATHLDGKPPPSSLAWWAQSHGVGVFSSGLSEATPLHLACHVASDGTKLESLGTRHYPAVVSAMPGDPGQIWTTLKEGQSKQTSQDPDSLDDAEISSLMDCDPVKPEFVEDRFFQEDDQCDIPWAHLVTRPPQHTLVVERMHSGARRYIVLDFGHVVRLTDIIIPSCADLVTLCIDIWVAGEERDCVKLAFATDIATKHLVFTDIQPPPRARYMKITTIGRYGMSAMKCKIPLGWFYGEVDEVAHAQASINSLSALHQDLTCRFRLATGKLMDLLSPYLELYSGNAAHMMAYLSSANEADPKVLAAYQECIEIQQQLHTCLNILRKLQGKSDCNEQMLELINKGRVNTDLLLERASTDKLRVMMENVVDMLLYFFFQVGDVPHEEPSRAWCVAVTGALAQCGGAAAAALGSLTAKLCGGAKWWGEHLADTLANAFAPYDAPPLPLDRVLILVMYMSRKSLLAHSAGHGVAEALAARCLALLRAPRAQPALTAAVLCALAAALDGQANLTLNHSRWEWVSGGRTASAPTTEVGSLQRSDCRMHRRKLHKKLLHQMQELEARRGIQVALEERQRARFGLKAHMTMLGKRGGSGGSGAPAEGAPAPQPPRLVTAPLARELAQALVDHMLIMDGASAADTLLLCAKVVGRLCALCGGAGLLDARCILGLARLAVTLPPWPRHALTTLLQDLVEFENGESSASSESAEWGGAGWAPDARVRVLGKSLGRKYKSGSVADVLADSFGLSKSSNFNKPKIVAITDSIKNSTSTIDYQLPLVAESDDSEPELEKLETLYDEVPKKESKPKPTVDTSSSSNISSCMDARLESGAEGGSEAAARRLLLTGSGALAAAVRAPPTLAPRVAPEPPPPRSGPPLAHTLYDVFRHLATEFQNQSDCTFMEHVVSLWLTLNGSVWSEGWAAVAAAAAADAPRVRLASDTVRALLHSLCSLETVSLRCWVLCMQALAWISSLPLQTEGSTQTMGRVILESEHFIPAMVKFVTINVHTDGAVFSSEPYLGGVSIGAGAGAASALNNVMARVVAGRGQAGALCALRIVLGVWASPQPGAAYDLHATLLRQAHPLLQAISDRHAPTATRLIDTVSHLVCNWVSECNYGRAAEGGDVRLSGFLADVLASGGGARRAPLRRSVLAQLLHYCRRLTTLTVTSLQQQMAAAAAAAASPSSPEYTADGQTDESKAARADANVEDERKQRPRQPTVADTVLQHPTIMHKFYKALSMCHGMNPVCLNTSSASEAGAGGAVEPLYSTLKEDVFWLVAQIADSASDPTLVCATIIDFLRKDNVLVLSAPLQQYIVRVLDKPAALCALADAGAVQMFADRMNRCHQSAPSSHQGLVSSLMNHLKLPPQLMNMSTSAKKSQQPLAENSSGLINFAPLCTVVCGNPTAQAADVLLGDGGASSGACAARRVRAAAWSYHFFSADDASLALTLTLPYAVQLHEIRLQPHLTSLATCPGAVGIEAGCGGILASLGPPQNTSGMNFIRLVVSRPIVCTTVQIRLYKPRDSSNMGLLQLRLLGAPAFNKTQTGTMSSNNWAGIVAACTRTTLPPSAWAAVTSPASIATLATLLAGGGPARAHAHRTLLACAAACPHVRAPLVHALLACDGEAHAHAFQPSSPERNHSAGAVWSLIRAVCVTGGDEAIKAVLAWLAAAAARSTPGAPPALHAPPAHGSLTPPPAPAAPVQVAAAVLWALKEEQLIAGVERLVTDELFELVRGWAAAAPDAALLKAALDSLLCSMCYIRPELFRKLLEQTDVNIDPSTISMEALTDDSKTSPAPAAPAAPARYSWRAARLQSLAAAAASPACARALLHSPLPLAAAETIRDFSVAKLRQIQEQDVLAEDDIMMEELAASSAGGAGNGAADAETDEIPSMKTINSLVEWLRALCLSREVKAWLGGAGACFWRPLLLLLCHPRPAHATWKESTEYAQLEESTIRLFAELTACHSDNQKLFAATLHDIVDSMHCSGPEGISGFTRALILRLLLSAERCRVGLRWANGSAGAGAGGTAPPRHPAAHAHHLLALPTHTTVAQICRLHLPPMPFPEEGPKPYSSSGAASTPTFVFRRASDTAIGNAVEAWELSLAAASASKDKRVKDVKNISLKQQGGKKKGRGETPQEASNDDLLDTSIRVQVCGLEGYVPPAATLGQLAAAAPPGSSPYLTLILHLDAASEPPATWSPPGAAGGAGSSSLLREFGACGGLALVAARLPRPRAAPAAPPRPPAAHHDLDWVKLDDQFEEVVELHGAGAVGGVVGGGSSTASDDAGGYCAVPAHALPALALLLKLKGFAAALLDEGPRAVQLLRLLLGAARDEDGRSIVVGTGNGNCSLGTLPFVVLARLLELAPLGSAEGAALRRALLAVGAVRLLLACLAVYTHHQPARDSQASNGSSGRAEDKSQLYWAKGTGFGTGSTQQSWNVEQAFVKLKTEEHHVTALLLVLASYMNPGEKWPPEEESPSEEGAEEGEAAEPDLPAEFVEMVAHSSLVPALCSYLRNDSVLDMSRHIPLYMCALRCARAVHGVGALRAAASPLPRLLQQMSRTTNSYATKLKMSKKNLFGKMTYSQRFSSTSNSELSEEDEGLAALIADIHASASLMCRSVEDEPVGAVPRPVSGASREARYIEVMRRLQFETFEMITECPESGYRFTVPYHFESTVRAAGERAHPQRMKRLAQEAATLATSLPLSHCSSVFVRTDADRLDVMKVLITGPSDTPYANGCFVLDVYFPAEYPAVPMLINLETTGRHSVRFNPNLYNDGKVCLSVLNTWHGRPEEKWNAHTSSFLQVLVSIQSLILVPEPYFNEPGYERSRGTRVGSTASLEYNSNIYQACVRWAMLDHLRNPEPCFKEVIQTHFWMKRNEIMATLAGWVAELEARPGDERTQRTIQHNLLALKRHFVKIQEELAKLPVPPGLEDMDEPFLLPAPTALPSGPPAPDDSPPAPAALAQAVADAHADAHDLSDLADPGDIDHDMEKIVSQVLD